jgi:hypothetical protein
MTRILTRWMAIGLLVTSGGCALGVGSGARHDLRDADFRQLDAGMRAAEVRRIVGPPALITPLPRLAEEVWDYRYFNGQSPMVTFLHFDMSGVLKYYTQGQDHDYYHGGAER